MVTLLRLAGLVFLSALTARSLPAAAPPPNFIVVFADDLGYADLGGYGAREIATPNLDRMAAEGMRFTSFYVAQAVCSASRAALLTGCYPNRVGIEGALGPKSPTGIHDRELTIAEVLKPRGYATAIYGKWHLGDAPQFLPTRHGFDEYFGLPYSNDMWPLHPDYVGLPPDSAQRKRGYPDLPLFENDHVAISPVTGAHQAQLTTWYTEHAVRFIEQHRDRPFFLYVPHAMPHVPLFVSDKFKGRSKAGLYGDVVMELDWSVGEILGAVRKAGLEERTLVIFTSDNGPWLLYGNHAGSARPFREGKGTMFEGGVRVPCVARWPGRIPAGTVCAELAATMDFLPTFARLAGTEPPRDRIVDGRDIWPLMSGQPGATTPHAAFYYYWGRELQAIRSGKWKLHFPHRYPKPQPAGGDGRPGKYAQIEMGMALYDLEADVGETTDVAAQHPDVVARLEALAEQARADLGDTATKRVGRGVREPGRLPESPRVP
jgi:arylsulfatase A